MLESELADAYFSAATEFFGSLLGLDFESLPLTNRTLLSDFSFCGVYGPILDGASSFEDAQGAWDKWILEMIQRRYSVELEQTSLPISKVMDAIVAHKQSPPKLH